MITQKKDRNGFTPPYNVNDYRPSYYDNEVFTENKTIYKNNMCDRATESRPYNYPEPCEIVRKFDFFTDSIVGNTYNLIGKKVTGNKSHIKIVEAIYIGSFENGIIDKYVFEFKPKDVEYFLQFDCTDNENHRIINKDILKDIIVLC